MRCLQEKPPFSSSFLAWDIWAWLLGLFKASVLSAMTQLSWIHPATLQIPNGGHCTTWSPNADWPFALKQSFLLEKETQICQQQLCKPLGRVMETSHAAWWLLEMIPSHLQWEHQKVSFWLGPPPHPAQCPAGWGGQVCLCTIIIIITWPRGECGQPELAPQENKGLWTRDWGGCCRDTHYEGAAVWPPPSLGMGPQGERCWHTVQLLGLGATLPWVKLSSSLVT